jgi:putative hydrolase of the HAD superfamily
VAAQGSVVEIRRAFYYCTVAVARSIHAVVFDFGGVLTLIPGPEHWRDLMAVIGGENGGSRLQAAQAGYQVGRDAYDRGELSFRDYWGAILRGLATPGDDGKSQRLFELDTAAWTRIRTEVVEWAAELRGAGIRTGILSNMPTDVLAVIRGRLAWLEEFSPTVYSCCLGLIKPDPAIYHVLIEELALAPESILFLDDRQENVEAARAQGLAAERFESLEQILPIVRERYGLPGGPAVTGGGAPG